MNEQDSRSVAGKVFNDGSRLAAQVSLYQELARLQMQHARFELSTHEAIFKLCKDGRSSAIVSKAGELAYRHK